LKARHLPAAVDLNLAKEIAFWRQSIADKKTPKECSKWEKDVWPGFRDLPVKLIRTGEHEMYKQVKAFADEANMNNHGLFKNWKPPTAK